MGGKKSNTQQRKPSVLFLLSLSLTAGSLHFKVQVSSWLVLTQVVNDPPNTYLQVFLVDTFLLSMIVWIHYRCN